MFMASLGGDDLEQLDRRRASIKRRLDQMEVDATLTDAQRASAAQYMRRGLSDFNVLINAAKKKARRRGGTIHLF